ncbi:MAG: acyl-CoA dehydrogenase family protein [Pseudomonadota bacterium]
MNFDFSEDARMVAEQTARLLADHCDARTVRSVLDGEASHAAEAWAQLGGLGLAGTALPAEHGGVGAGYLPLCLVARELGAAVAPVPFSSSVYLAAEAILRFGSAEQRSRWLPELASGALIGTLALVESAQRCDAASIEAQVTNGTLSGRKLLVPDGGLADIAVVIARSPAGLDMYLCDLHDNGVARAAVSTVDPTRDSATLDFAGSAVEPLGGVADGDGWQRLDALYDRAAVLFAFEQLGGAQSALDMAVAYAQQRYAFGRPIGSFQGLKHIMADMYVALKLAESNCYYAAWALETDADDLALAAATARVSATQAYQLCSRDNIQVHGGMGFTWEFDCHLYYRRSNYLALQLGGLSDWERKLVAATRRAA